MPKTILQQRNSRLESYLISRQRLSHQGAIFVKLGYILSFDVKGKYVNLYGIEIYLN